VGVYTVLIRTPDCVRIDITCNSGVVIRLGRHPNLRTDTFWADHDFSTETASNFESMIRPHFGELLLKARRNYIGGLQPEDVQTTFESTDW
jgi:hypothetical protein